ncbi:hypothetical protein OCAR_6567 [Afipia carboxidovorans OM5]|nr:hypothetical protein OCAR_6567 [Afipia carboxidovorans OM5]
MQIHAHLPVDGFDRCCVVSPFDSIMKGPRGRLRTERLRNRNTKLTAPPQRTRLRRACSNKKGPAALPVTSLVLCSGTMSGRGGVRERANDSSRGYDPSSPCARGLTRADRYGVRNKAPYQGVLGSDSGRDQKEALDKIIFD